MQKKRENVLKVRYSDDELKYLKDFVRMPLAKYVRETSLDKVVTRHTSLPTVDSGLMRQLIRAGTNLNQAVKVANQQSAYLGSVDLVLLAGELAMIRYQLDMILETHKLVEQVEDLGEVFDDDWLNELQSEIENGEDYSLSVSSLADTLSNNSQQ